jgi:hypothetical protein
LNDENRATKRNITSRKRSNSSSFSSTEDKYIGLILVSTDEEDSENDAQYLNCKHLFSEDKRGEKWVRCTKCYEWCHEEWAGEHEDRTHSPVVTALTTNVVDVTFTSNLSFQFGQTCY